MLKARAKITNALPPMWRVYTPNQAIIEQELTSLSAVVSEWTQQWPKETSLGRFTKASAWTEEHTIKRPWRDGYPCPTESLRHQDVTSLRYRPLLAWRQHHREVVVTQFRATLLYMLWRKTKCGSKPNQVEAESHLASESTIFTGCSTTYSEELCCLLVLLYFSVYY